MVITELRNAVIDIVEFIIPPYLKLIISLIVSSIVTYGNFPNLTIEQLNSVEFGQLKSLIDNLYLSSVVPILAVLVIIALAYIINQIISFVSSIIPIYFHTISAPKEKYFVLRIWKYFPEIDNWNSLSNKINELISFAKDKNQSSLLWQLDWQKEKQQKNFRKINFLEFLIAWSILSFFLCKSQYNIEVSSIRLWAVLFILIVSTIFYYFIIAKNQIDIEQTEFMIVNQYIQSDNSFSINQEKVSDIESKIDTHIRMDKKWWWLSFGYKLDWLKMYKYYNFKIPFYDTFIKWKHSK